MMKPEAMGVSSESELLAKSGSMRKTRITSSSFAGGGSGGWWRGGSSLGDASGELFSEFLREREFSIVAGAVGWYPATFL